jgi:hypothetical protein
MPVVPAVGRLRQHNLEFKTSLGYTVSSSLRRKKIQKQKQKTYRNVFSHSPGGWKS